MTTLAAWIADTRDHLDGSRSEEANQLDAAHVSGDGTLRLRYSLGGIAPGALLSVGLSTFRVVATNPIGKEATVLPAQQGTADADADEGSLVRVNPRFTDFRITRALNAHLGSLSSPTNGLYQVNTSSFTYNSAIAGYDLDVDPELLRVIEVRRQEVGVSRAWPKVDRGLWEVIQPAPSDDFNTINALIVKDGSSGFTIQVTYAARFEPIAEDLAAEVTDTGLHNEAHDIPPLGAAIRLMSGREVSRNHPNAQGDSRRANEVPPGAVGASYRGLVGLWSQRVQEEAARLKQRYPVGR